MSCLMCGEQLSDNQAQALELALLYLDDETPLKIAICEFCHRVQDFFRFADARRGQNAPVWQLWQLRMLSQWLRLKAGRA